MVKKRVKEDVRKAVKGVPFLVKVISVLNYINAAFFVVAAILLLVYGILGKEITLDASVITAQSMIIAGVIFLALGVLAFYIARGLWKGHNWARIVEIVIGIVGIIFGVSSVIQQVELTSNLIGIAINGLITGYLAFDRKVKAAFS